MSSRVSAGRPVRPLPTPGGRWSPAGSLRGPAEVTQNEDPPTVGVTDSGRGSCRGKGGRVKYLTGDPGPWADRERDVQD